MLKEYKKIIGDFEKKAHPVDMVNYIMQKEILYEIKMIRKEMKNEKINKV